MSKHVPCSASVPAWEGIALHPFTVGKVTIMAIAQAFLVRLGAEQSPFQALCSSH